MRGIEPIKNIITEHKDELRTKFKVKQLGLFGSYVRAMQSKGSDLDILVDFEKSVSLLGVVKLENFLSSLLEIKTDIVPREDIRPELKKRILKEVIYV